jgi:hypothetical protein
MDPSTQIQVTHGLPSEPNARLQQGIEISKLRIDGPCCWLLASPERKGGTAPTEQFAK